MENPKCPYCGDTMELMESSTLPYTRYFYKCDNCGSTSPDLRMKTPEKAYAAAMKRDRAKGEWELWAGALPKCPVCGYEYADYIECDKFCGNCGADMRKEANDER